MTAKRFVLVDDDEAQLHGRRAWLLDPGAFAEHRGISTSACEAMGFEEAYARTDQQWQATDVLIVDALDQNSDDKRRRRAEEWDVRYDPMDYIAGQRVVNAAREANSELAIIVISTIAKENPYVSRRMRGAGADFVIEKSDVNERADFCKKVSDLLRGARPARAGRDDRVLAEFARDFHHYDPESARSAFGTSRATRAQADGVAADVRRAVPMPETTGTGRAVDKRRYRPVLRAVMGWVHRRDKGPRNDSP